MLFWTTWIFYELKKWFLLNTITPNLRVLISRCKKWIFFRKSECRTAATASRATRWSSRTWTGNIRELTFAKDPTDRDSSSMIPSLSTCYVRIMKCLKRRNRVEKSTLWWDRKFINKMFVSSKRQFSHLIKID